MSNRKLALAGALLLGVSVIATQALGQAVAPTTPPDPPAFDAASKVEFVGAKDLWEYKALPEYHEPDWVTKNFVDKGLLPPVKDRLPKEPLVFKTGTMPDGIGVYGDSMRHVIGGRPQTWNFWGGLNYGWGGIDNAMNECLTRTGPLFEVKAEEIEPLPNLAKSWDWSADGHQLTMHLIEGAKWSDGVAFNADDVMFYWEDNISDPNVKPLNSNGPDSFGVGTTLKKIDDNTVLWTFKEAFPKQYLYTMAYGGFCPLPAHILKPMHPKYSKNTYDQYQNAFPPEYMNFPVMGAWVPVEYRPDDIVVLRRNPYYWKVDENGNQLPYLDENTYKLSTWADRDVQTLAGTADLSNLEQPENYVESLKKAADPASPARLEFGQRLGGYILALNFSANGAGDPDARAQAVRDLNRNVDFRKAVTTAIDRQRLGDSLVKGPFTQIYPGGILAGTAFYDKASTVYYPYSVEQAKAYFAAAGLTDTDGDGFVNFPAGVAGGGNVEIKILGITDFGSDRNLTEALISMMQDVGLKVIADLQSNTQRDALRDASKYDWVVNRLDNVELLTVVQNTAALAPTGPQIAINHRAGTDGSLDLMPFEQQMVDIVNKFNASQDAAERVDLMKQYQKLYTDNVDVIGLVQYPTALILNKRFANVPKGAPVHEYQYSEDTIMRERMFVPTDKQADVELEPDTLPGKPGDPGPVKG